MHGARNLHFFLFQELKKLEVENSWLMSTVSQPPDTGHVCSVTGVHFPPGSVTHCDVLDQGFEEKLLEFRRQAALSFQDEIQYYR